MVLSTGQLTGHVLCNLRSDWALSIPYAHKMYIANLRFMVVFNQYELSQGDNPGKELDCTQHPPSVSTHTYLERSKIYVLLRTTA